MNITFTQNIANTLYITYSYTESKDNPNKIPTNTSVAITLAFFLFFIFSKSLKGLFICSTGTNMNILIQLNIPINNYTGFKCIEYIFPTINTVTIYIHKNVKIHLPWLLA